MLLILFVVIINIITKYWDQRSILKSIEIEKTIRWVVLLYIDVSADLTGTKSANHVANTINQ